MLDVIHKNFEERLSGFQRAVLAVDTGMDFYGFSIEKQPKPDIQKEAS